MRLTLHIWRQANPQSEGRFVAYDLPEVSKEMSFLEMLDALNDQLTHAGDDPVAFDHDCREGICGSCGMMINGVAHGPRASTATCQLHMREFNDGETLVIEPWRARALPVLKDLTVDRSPLDRIVAAGGYVSVNTGSPPDANAIAVPKPDAERAFDAAACIGCGACVAQCPNGAAQLFTSAKLVHLASLPQGQPERDQRAINMVETMEAEGFGPCSNHRECEAVCPVDISIANIAIMNREYARAKHRQPRPAKID